MLSLFITFHWFDAIDILLVAFLLYELYSLVRGTAAINIVMGMVLLYILWLIVKALDMQLFGSILSRFIDVGVIAIIIVFQQEFRRFLLVIGKTEFFNRKNFTKNFLMLQMDKNELDIHPILKACRNLAERQTGALIVIAHDSDLGFYAQTGDIIDSNVTEALLESIFYKNNPLHDGAVIIQENKIHAARCVLPSTEKSDFPATLGMRHRAAVGITEKSDAIAIAVSEQTGSVSLAHRGKLYHDLNAEKLATMLQEKLQ